MNSKPPPTNRSSLPSPARSPLPAPQPLHPPLPALPFHPPPGSPLNCNSPPPTYNTPPPTHNYYSFPHPLSILSCADLPPPTFSSNYQSPPTFKAEFRTPFFPPPPGQGHPQLQTMQHFRQQYRNGGNWGVVEGGRLSGDAFAEGHVEMGGGCGWWSRKIIYYSGGQPVRQVTGGGYDGYGEQGQWQSPTPPGSPGPQGI